MKYFDSHIHFFPQGLAQRALEKLSDICGCPYFTDGTLEDTLEKLLSWGCVGGMALHIATAPKQQTSVNTFAAASQGVHTGLHIACFGSVHPFSEEALEELDRIKALGLHGVKFHPDYQDFFVGDERAYPIYERAAALGLPLAFHTGFDPYSPENVHCPPKALGEICDTFPTLTVIAAHMGGLRRFQEAATYLAGRKNVYFDTAFASRFLTPAALEELILLHGPDKVLFASDCPWSTVPEEIQLLDQLHLSPKDREAIAWQNSRRLFSLDI